MLISFSGRIKQIFFMVTKPPILSWLQPRKNNCVPTELDVSISANETQWPTAARRWHFALRNVSHKQSCHLLTPSHPQVPLVWPYCPQAQCGRWHSLKWIIADILTISHPHMSASHLFGFQVRANEPSLQKLIRYWYALKKCDIIQFLYPRDKTSKEFYIQSLLRRYFKRLIDL